MPETEDSRLTLRASQKKTTGVGKEKERTCYFCYAIGHYKQNCSKYKRWKNNKERAEKANVTDQSDQEDNEHRQHFCFVVRRVVGHKSSWLVD